MEETNKKAQQEEEKEKFVRLHRTKKEEYRRNVNLLMALKDGSRENGNEGTSRSSRVGHLTGGEVVERTANGSNREEIGGNGIPSDQVPAPAPSRSPSSLLPCGA